MTSCSGICALLGRDGDDSVCMPETAQCDTWKSKDSWPSQHNGQTATFEVGAWCLCSGKSRGRASDATIFTGVSHVPVTAQMSATIPAASSSTTSAGRGHSTTWPDDRPWVHDSVSNPLAMSSLGRSLEDRVSSRRSQHLPRNSYHNETYGRQLDAYDGRWSWPEATVKGIDPFHVTLPHNEHTAHHTM